MQQQTYEELFAQNQKSDKQGIHSIILPIALGNLFGEAIRRPYVTE